MYKNNIYSALLTLFLVSCSSSNDNVNKFGDENSNSAPELVGLIDFAIDENSTEVTQFTATDPDNDPITYSINGIDSSLLTIDDDSGLLTLLMHQIMKIHKIMIKIIFIQSMLLLLMVAYRQSLE